LWAANLLGDIKYFCEKIKIIGKDKKMKGNLLKCFCFARMDMYLLLRKCRPLSLSREEEREERVSLFAAQG
jgi:hypothetical protein